MENILRKKIAEGIQPIGTFLELGSSAVVEALGQTGLDFVIIDNEHAPYEAESTANFIRAALLHGLCPMARARELSRPAILKLLDVGAQGIVVPDIHTLDQVKELVGYAKFAPIGQRGFCPTRKDGWGFQYPATAGVAVNMEYCNQETLLFPQCETVGALSCIEEIAALDGVDGVFIGPFDLSISMGIPGQFDHPDFQAALERIKKACHDAGKLCIYFTGSEETVKSSLAQGYDMIGYNLDAAMLITAYRDALARIRG